MPFLCSSGLVLLSRRLDQFEGWNFGIVPFCHHLVAALTVSIVMIPRGEALERHYIHCPAVWTGVGASRGGVPCLDHVRLLCGMKGTFDGLRLLRDDEEQHPSGGVWLALALLPIAKGAEREAVAG